MGCMCSKPTDATNRKGILRTPTRSPMQTIALSPVMARPDIRDVLRVKCAEVSCTLRRGASIDLTIRGCAITLTYNEDILEMKYNLRDTIRIIEFTNSLSLCLCRTRWNSPSPYKQTYYTPITPNLEEIVVTQEIL